MMRIVFVLVIAIVLTAHDLPLTSDQFTIDGKLDEPGWAAVCCL